MNILKRFGCFLIAVILSCGFAACGTSENIPEGSVGISFGSTEE